MNVIKTSYSPIVHKICGGEIVLDIGIRQTLRKLDDEKAIIKFITETVEQGQYVYSIFYEFQEELIK